MSTAGVATCRPLSFQYPEDFRSHETRDMSFTWRQHVFQGKLPMPEATAMPSMNRQRPAAPPYHLRRLLGLLLGIVPIIGLAQHSNPTVPAGFPNVTRSPGERIAGNIAPNQGRTAIIAYHNGVLFTVPEAPSSNPGSDLQVRTWDISTPANLANPVELMQWGVTPMPIEAHGYFKNGDWLSIGDNRDWDPMLEPWAFEANPGGGVLRTSNPDFVCAGVRGCLFAPWILPAGRSIHPAAADP